MLYTVYASDDLSHGPEDIFSREETLATLERVSLELARVGLPVLPSLGNHDIIPKNQVTLSVTPTHTAIMLTPAHCPVPHERQLRARGVD